MDSRNGYNQRRSDLKFELDKRINLLEEKVRGQDLRTEAIIALRDLYSFRIATTYVDEATHNFAPKGLTRKDIENIHKDILNIQHIPRLFVNDVYDIVHAPEAKIDEVISHFLRGESIIPALLNKRVKDVSQANIAWKIIRFDNLLWWVRHRSLQDWNRINFRISIGMTV